MNDSDEIPPAPPAEIVLDSDELLLVLQGLSLREAELLDDLHDMAGHDSKARRRLHVLRRLRDRLFAAPVPTSPP